MPGRLSDLPPCSGETTVCLWVAWKNAWALYPPPPVGDSTVPARFDSWLTPPPSAPAAGAPSPTVRQAPTIPSTTLRPRISDLLVAIEPDAHTDGTGREVPDPAAPSEQTAPKLQKPVSERRFLQSQRIMAPVLFELDGVTLSRGGKVVLDGVGANLPEGASCLAGPS